MKGPGAAQPRNNAPFHSLSDTYTWSYMNDPPRLPQDLIWSAAPLSPASAPTDVFIIALSRRRRAGRGRRGAGGEGAEGKGGEQEPPCSWRAPEMPRGAHGHQGVPVPWSQNAQGSTATKGELPPIHPGSSAHRTLPRALPTGGEEKEFKGSPPMES